MNLRTLQGMLLAITAVVSLGAKKDKDSVLDSINQRTAYIAKTVTALNESQPCTKIINASDLGTTGYVISDEGTYCLGEDITFSPANSGVAAITIAAGAQNVNLNFDSHVLEMDPLSTTSNNFGVLVQAGCQDTSIYGGTIKGFSASQIKALENLNFFSVADMLLVGIPQSQGGSRIDGVVETSANGLFINGTQTIVSTNIIITNVRAHNFYLNIPTIPNLSVLGISLNYCQDILMEKAEANNIDLAGPVTSFGAGTSGGIILQHCNDVICRECVTYDNTAITPNNAGNVTGVTHGIAFLQSNRIRCSDCSAFNNVATQVCGGFQVVDTCTDFVFERCVAQNNHLVDPGAAGVQAHLGFEIVGNPFYGPCSNGVFRDCYVNGQQNGFQVIGGENIILENCTATAGDLGDTNVYPGPFGFVIAVGANNVSLRNCVAMGFEANDSPTALLGYGIYLWNTFGDGAPTNVNIRGCKSTGNNIGIAIDNGTTNAVIQNNEVAFNTQYGISDNTTVKTLAYLSNLAYANGTPAALANNYNGLPTGTPVRTWTIGAAPSATDSNGILDAQLDNMSVLP